MHAYSSIDVYKHTQHLRGLPGFVLPLLRLLAPQWYVVRGICESTHSGV